MLMNQGVTRERRAIELGLHPDAGWADINLAAYKKRQAEKHPGFWSRLARFLFG